MRLYFFRHAQAEDGQGRDFDRALTSLGRQRTETAAQVLKKLGLNKVRRLYGSPRLRAFQTAEILAATLGVKVDVVEALDFGFDVESVATLTRDSEMDDDYIFVGHEPSFSSVVRLMTGANIDMKKGGLARVDVTYHAAPLRGDLIWLVAPKVFDSLDD